MLFREHTELEQQADTEAQREAQTLGQSNGSPGFSDHGFNSVLLLLLTLES